MRNPNSPLTSLVSDEDPGRQWCLGKMVSEHYHHHGFSGNYSYTWEVGRLPGGRWGETFPTEILLHQCLVSHQLPVSRSSSPAVSSTVIVQDFALSGSGGWMGRRAGTGNCGSHVGFFLLAYRQKEQASFSTNHLSMLFPHLLSANRNRIEANGDN